MLISAVSREQVFIREYVKIHDESSALSKPKGNAHGRNLTKKGHGLMLSLDKS